MLQGNLLAARKTVPHRAALLHSVSSFRPENGHVLSTIKHQIRVTTPACGVKPEESGLYSGI